MKSCTKVVKKVVSMIPARKKSIRFFSRLMLEAPLTHKQVIAAEMEYAETR
ncbi:hypothetical protein VIBNISFn118_10016 [Vibrio nigripulchritudo SFn118]|nr:hypothetical protein VIBNISFn118_10016 [Vibrio nigripulchritudo SFn118]